MRSTPPETMQALENIKELIKEYDESCRDMKRAMRSGSPSMIEDAWSEQEMALERLRKSFLRHADALVHVVRNYIA